MKEVDDWNRWATPPRATPLRDALAPLLSELSAARYRVLARLRAGRPLPAAPLGYIVLGHARFPIREPITLQDGQVWFTGTTMNPFARRLPRDVTTYQIVGSDGVLVHEGRIHPDMYDIVTTSSMSMSYTARIQLQRGGPCNGT